jgi:hypothetical protein
MKITKQKSFSFLKTDTFMVAINSKLLNELIFRLRPDSRRGQSHLSSAPAGGGEGACLQYNIKTHLICGPNLVMSTIQ